MSAVSPSDLHLPAVHPRPPRNWLNDPNGLVFHDAHFHLFFQYNPHSARHANTHWGHFRSADLLTWEELPIALAPEPNSPDADGCWSGNAVDLGDRLLAFYSAKRDDHWYQPVAAAESWDGGLTFTKLPDLVVPEPPAGTTMFRDPYVWRHHDRWRMLVGAALADGRGAALLYESDENHFPESWTFKGPFLARHPEPLPGGGDTEEGWECTQYVDFGDDRGAVLISAWDPERGAQQAAAYTGRSHRNSFEAGAPQRLDHGPDFYAPAVLRVPGDDARWLMWAWAWEARDAEHPSAASAWADEAGWAGLLTLPRDVSLSPDGTLHQQPATELTALRSARLIHTDGVVTPAEPVALGTVGRAFDAVIRLNRRDGTAAGLRLVTSADGREHLDLDLDPTNGDLIVSRDHASLDARARGGIYRLPACDTEQLRLIVDHSIAEIFTAEGQVLTLRFYPVGEGPWHLEASANGVPGRARFSADVHALRHAPRHANGTS